MSDLLRVYLDPAEIGPDGYPFLWHRGAEFPRPDIAEGAVEQRFGIKHLVRAEADHRCVRCGHPYRNGEHGNGEWSACDDSCSHPGPIRIETSSGFIHEPLHGFISVLDQDGPIEAQWRILTVHHLNGVKHDCRWWNLAALCQRCHLTIQAKVYMDRVYPFEHSEWFKPYAAGFYAWRYLDEELTRAQTFARLPELLALEQTHERFPGL